MLDIANIEYNLAYSCAPCLAGLKPSNLISISAEDFKQFFLLDKDLLESKGFYLRVLCACEKGVQILLYKKKALEELIRDERVQAALLMFGYEPGMSLEDMLNLLALKMHSSQADRHCKRCCTFPHEIGLFLGYPVYDVLEYYRRRGEGCIFSGYWKVYADAEKAAETFDQYNECKKHFALQIESGLRLYDLLSA
ncbi:DUF3793 family protein [Treponema sp. OMZ 787]|uniref:DUF3793 family protein n=1 Tax=Treponema sp. OMZ 787 TaxID=2563669 RepID=UPI0020A4E402|nr:DUF3793 family protein [Treponema sp. OMZ 787]UTC62691.1 DUF3793 family protein [Treponema sp. OMZ 787]